MRLHGYHARLRRVEQQVAGRWEADTCRCAPPFVRVEHRPPDRPDQPAEAAEAAPPDRCPRCGGGPAMVVIVERVSASTSTSTDGAHGAARRPASGAWGDDTGDDTGEG